MIADHVAEATILFADLVGFTQIAGHAAAGRSGRPAQSHLLGVRPAGRPASAREKIKTIGDAYMVAVGLPEPRPDHAEAAGSALAMLGELGRFRASDGARDQPADRHPYRAGGRRRDRRAKVLYDVWGTTVNIASRMESLGVPGKSTSARPSHRRSRPVLFVDRGLIDVKGAARCGRSSWAIR